MPRGQTRFLSNFTLIFLFIIHAASTADVSGVSRICGRIEIGGHEPHEKPKLFQVAPVKGIKSNISRPGDHVTHHSYRTHYYQHVKKQSKRIWRGGCKHQHGHIYMLWTRRNQGHKEKVAKLPLNPKEYTRIQAQLMTPRSLPYISYRYAKKIKRQDVSSIHKQQSSQVSLKSLSSSKKPFKSYPTDAVKSLDYIESKKKLATLVKEDVRKFPYLQFDKKKRNLPRLAPFTAKPMRTPPPFVEFSESFLMLTVERDTYTSPKGIHHTTRTPLHNNRIHDRNEKIATKRNQRRIISFYWASENTTEYRTTVEDKIKFFENYDQYTAAGHKKKVEMGKLYDLSRNDKRTDFGNLYDMGDNLKVRLDDVNQNIPHVDDNYFYSKTAVKRENDHTNAKNRLSNKQLEAEVNPNIQKHVGLKNLSPYLVQKYNNDVNINSSGFVPASWTKYPFTAVYIYEPSQVHCDAAALSPHWLITSGACLYRPQRDLALGGPSAFVTYCGADWRVPERITYVKYSVVHPEYHPRDHARRHRYNIGLVRVVNSMQSSCAGWSPVSMRLNQFVADPKGSPATVLGWGVDRYAGLDSTTDLAKLMKYDGKIYSEICPGNSEYNKLVPVTVKPNADPNIYCLLLPRRMRNEDDDQPFGSLLLVEGKLVGLYLEDEQRKWAEPSAQFTSIWRLTAWIQTTAREPVGAENITVVDI